jgi:hypothetical protein
VNHAKIGTIWSDGYSSAPGVKFFTPIIREIVQPANVDRRKSTDAVHLSDLPEFDSLEARGLDQRFGRHGHVYNWVVSPPAAACCCQDARSHGGQRPVVETQRSPQSRHGLEFNFDLGFVSRFFLIFSGIIIALAPSVVAVRTMPDVSATVLACRPDPAVTRRGVYPVFW